MESRPIEKKHALEVSVIIWTILKILLLVAINILAFLPIPFYVLWVIFGCEVLIGILVKISIQRIIPIIKFLAFNLIPLLILLYFVEHDWLSALIHFGEYTSKIFLLLMSVVLLVEITPMNILVVSLSKIGIPKVLTFIIATGITFIPLLSSQLRTTVQAQKARGYRLNIFKLKPVLVPTILYLLELSTNLSLSLESRGFNL